MRLLRALLLGAALWAPACLQALGAYETVEVEGVGTTTCKKDGDCPRFLSCAKPPGASTGVCTWACDESCDSGTLCMNGKCVVPCTLQADCPSGFQCLDLGSERGCAPNDWRSGADMCNDDTGCGVMPCEFITDYTPGLCVAGCIADQCPTGSVCVYSGLGETCLLACGTGCPTGMHCVDTFDDGQVCIPSTWLAQSATTSCTSNPCPVVECAELDGTYTGVCAEKCTQQRPCSAGKRCISGAGLGPSCLLDCAADPLICDPLTCITLPPDGTKICAPESWSP